ncbi:universal stress protein [Halostagnicola kamekurae]|uniref:Nucleotide-binding universal stress protein, UspA family n=1 Tax=Halostagnicola kamekurae TaxID=619731 RepID=A0A1I6UVB8_9EURY|nr:universal stress protein [Halostagnicola kamekurae]SFT05274.1 Nucleotide-binding universal stress protein, UspA family [Halostagnicola kamekurae]
MVIVAAVDRSDRADTVIKQAEVLAETFDDTIHIIHVLSTSEFVDLGRTKAKKGDSIDLESVKNVASDIAEEAAEPLISQFEAIGLMGDPADEIINYADEQNARYIVVAGRKRSPAGKAIFGSVNQSILLNSDCPVVMSTDN